MWCTSRRTFCEIRSDTPIACRPFQTGQLWVPTGRPDVELSTQRQILGLELRAAYAAHRSAF